MSSVLFVCMANVCRSPMARLIATDLARRCAGWTERPSFDAAGTHAGPGRSPIDRRARAALAERGYLADRRRSRAVAAEDFERHDLLLAMDRACLQALQRQCPPQHVHKLALLLDFAPERRGQDVPDPYYSDAAGFEIVLGLCELGVRGLIESLQRAQMPLERPL